MKNDKKLVLCFISVSIIVSIYKVLNNRFYSTDKFPALKILEDNWKIIADEYAMLPKDVMIKNGGRSQNSWYGDNEFKELAKLHETKYGWVNGWKVGEKGANKNWNNWGLVFDGNQLGKNAEMCPRTSKLLASIPGIQVAGFSVLKPDSVITPHTDSTGIKYNSLTYHLGLDIPHNGNNKLHVSGNSMKQQNGKAFLFDATHSHHTYNTSKTHDRAILYMAVDISNLQ